MSHKRRILFAFFIALVFVVAVFVSFAVNLLFRKTPSVVLPDLSDTHTTTQPGQDDNPDSNVGYLPVDVTPETVQAVIRTLSRPDSYTREMTVDLHWSAEQSARTTITVWQDGGYTRVQSVPPTGLTQYNLTDGTQLYRWYAGSSSYVTLPLEDERSIDLVQRIPTYEDILSLPMESIMAAGYEVKQEVPCIYVAVADGTTETRYWVSLQSGLLAGVEKMENSQLTYVLEAYTAPITPCPVNASFKLPNGTELHTVAR